MNRVYFFTGCLLLGTFVSLCEWRGRLSHALIWAIVLLNGLLLSAVLYPRKGYLDHRHVLPVTVLTLA